jgi:hypothetical protein
VYGNCEVPHYSRKTTTANIPDEDWDEEPIPTSSLRKTTHSQLLSTKTPTNSVENFHAEENDTEVYRSEVKSLKRSKLNESDSDLSFNLDASSSMSSIPSAILRDDDANLNRGVHTGVVNRTQKFAIGRGILSKPFSFCPRVWIV